MLICTDSTDLYKYVYMCNAQIKLHGGTFCVLHAASLHFCDGPDAPLSCQTVLPAAGFLTYPSIYMHWRISMSAVDIEQMAVTWMLVWRH